MALKFPKSSQWKRIFKVLQKKEKITFLIFSALFIGSLIFLINSLYVNNTNLIASYGGTYSEGAVGQPRFINPIYGETNDIDRDLINLVFSGLLKYDDNGKIVPDLAESYTVSDDGKIYEFKIKNNAFWHDGKKVNAEDVAFTIKTIQNSDYKSPLRANWLDVSAEIISEKDIKIKLKSPYNSFLESCTLKIIPKHVWENILPENFALSVYNLRPMGSGPYQFSGLSQSDTGFINSLTLSANTGFYNSVPYISTVIYTFFESSDDLVKAANKKTIDGFAFSNLNSINIPKGFNVYSFSSPRYFATFFNTIKSDIFSDINVRQAFNYGTDKPGLVNKIDNGISQKYNIQTFQIVNSPVLPEFFGYNQPTKNYDLNLDKANSLLDKAGFLVNDQGPRAKSIQKKPAFQFKTNLAAGSKGTDVEQLQACLAKDPEVYQGDVTGYFGTMTKEAVTKFQKKYSLAVADKSIGTVESITRKKLNELCTPPAQNTLPLQFNITTVNQPQLVAVANELKSQWEKFGASVTVDALDLSDLKTAIKSRNYDVLLYGESLGMIPDLYPFWDSSQKIDPGLNLSEYTNKTADKLLQSAREALDDQTRQEKYESFQDTLIAEAPAVFLYNSNYLYVISTKVNGVGIKKAADPSKRLLGIANWFVKTRRIWK